MGHIVDYDGATGEHWVAWKRGAVDEALELARSIATPELAPRYEQAVRELDSVLEAELHLAGGVWVPDPADQPWGQFTLAYVRSADGGPLDPEKVRRSVRKAPKVRDTRVLDHSVSLGDIDAGRLLAQVEVRGFRDTGVVLSRIAFTVFPTGADEALRLEFVTNVPSAFPALSEDALDMVQLLTVVVE